MFPYPSGAGLHVGHPEGYTATDIICRYKRMNGYKVLHPMGWDAFGLPAENFAIKTGVHPEKSTNQNIANFTRQIKSLGFSYDWNREFSTTDKDYYRWTQWLFLKFYEKGLLYEEEKPMNWCPKCKVVCANEEVESGKHERCGSLVEKKALKQWMFKITDYAERLLNDLDAPNVVFLHGWGGTGTAGWFGDIQQFLKTNNIVSHTTDFPNTENPVYEEWKAHFEKELLPKINQNTVILGHSLGCGFLQRYLTEENLKVSEIVFSAPTVNDCNIAEIANFFTKEFDYEKIKNSADNIFVFGGGKDEYISEKEFRFLAKKLSAHLVFDETQDHCGQSSYDANPFVFPYFEKMASAILDWPEKIKAMQRNWIGKSTGINIEYPTIFEYKKTYIQKKRGTKGAHPRKENSSDSIRFSRIGNIVFAALQNVNKKKYNNQIEKIQETLEVNNQKILFDGFAMLEHWKKRKNEKEIKDRTENAVTVIKALPHLWYETEEIAYFKSGKNIFRVVFEILSPGEKRLKTYYKVSDLSKEYNKRKANGTLSVTCYTTRPDTNFGATFVTLAPEHQLIQENLESLPNAEEVKKYVAQAMAKSDIDRMADGKKKTGVFTGMYVINRVNGRKLPLYVGDFVLAHVGTGAVVGVPGHDVRDFEFAQAMGIEVIRVVISPDGDDSPIIKVEQVQEHAGKMINSDFLDGLDIMEAKEKISDHYVSEGWATRETNYRLRDWIFTRQRYWGEPIPLVNCEKCGTQPLSPLLKYEDEYFRTQKKGACVRLKSEDDAFTVDSHVPRTKFSHSVTILQKDCILCKEKTLNSLSKSSHFAKAPSIIKNKTGEIHTKWKWVYKHFLNKDNGYYKFVNIRAKWRNVVIEALSHYDFSEKKEEYAFQALSADGVVQIVVSRRNDRLYLTTFYPLFHFTQKIEKYLPQNVLPLTLPDTPNYEPSETGESPLSKIDDWVNAECPCCGGNAKRETSTMPNWAGSSWYWLRFMDAKNDQEAWSKAAEKEWGPVDLYVGGAEHAVLHLLYARFWHKALYDMGLTSTKEPFKKLVNQGLILSYAYENKDGGLVPVDEVEEKMVDGEPKYFAIETSEEVKKIVAKMSKSLKNVVNPDDIIEEHGADTLRMYEMFMGPFEQSKAWDTGALEGMHKFLARIHRYFSEKEIVDACPSEELIRLTHKTVKKVSHDIEEFKFNTAISQMMVWMNEFSKLDKIPKTAGGKFIRLLAPFAPHLAEELWKKLKPDSETLTFENWPSYKEELTVDNEITYGVQVNGKVRGELTIAKNAGKDECLSKARELEKVTKFINEAIENGGQIRKEIFVPGKIIGFVVK
jgi:leucyl-tRNA synthetase/predicted alpha/beta hydrolase family esterase